MFIEYFINYLILAYALTINLFENDNNSKILTIYRIWYFSHLPVH
jgi:hypothetical protein